MGDKPVTALWGIGERTAARLAEAGIRTVAELARTDHNDLAARFGPTIGPNLRLLALGGHAAPIEGEPHVPRSRSRETTYERDLTERPEIEAQVAALARDVTESVVDEGRRVTHVAVKVRTSTFFTRSRIRKLREPTVDPAVVATTALGMLDLFELHRPIR
jgi:DNA polymerase-4